ncbi:MAG: RNA-directed DNA polymerase [Vampirovibrio sp.]|nr:RNA-directed DNA polymerase [Vampirovibrio sp.]
MKLLNRKSKHFLSDWMGSKVWDIHPNAPCFYKPIQLGKRPIVIVNYPYLKNCQKNILKVLQNEFPPDYLHSPAKGKSNITNATVHRFSKDLWTLDISSFFSNVTETKVFGFFYNYFKLSPEIATALTNLTTYPCFKAKQTEKVLPQGTCTSPYLAFWCNKQMFDFIDTLCKEQNCIFTLYVDDITISGEKVPKTLIHKIRSILNKNGYRLGERKDKNGEEIGLRKIRRYGQDKDKSVTGVIIKKNGEMIAIPKVYQKLKKSKKEGEINRVKGTRNYLSQINKAVSR